MGGGVPVDQGFAIIILLGVCAGGAAAWFLARHYGFWAGLLLPGLLVAFAAIALGAPVGHAEEVMGRGMLGLFVMLPLTVATALGAVIGWVQHLRARPQGPK